MKIALRRNAVLFVVLAGLIACQSTPPPAATSSATALEQDVRRQISVNANVSGVTVTAVGATVYLEGVPPGMEQQVVRLASGVPGVAQVVVGMPPLERYLCPYFPWPPPQASAFYQLPRRLFVLPGETQPRLDAVAKTIRTALADAGYSEATLFAAPDGFAIATRMEQIDADGYPKKGAERWASKVSPPSKFSLSEYLEALLRGRPGQYRVIVLLVTPYPVTMADRIAPPADFQNIYSVGALSLPPQIGANRLSLDYTITALIYQFSRADHDEEWKLMVPSRVTGKDHLDRAQIIASLEHRDVRK